MTYGSKFIQKIYFRLFYPVKNIVSTLYGIKSRYERYGIYYNKWFNYLIESQFYPNEKLIKILDEYTLSFVNDVLNSNSFLSSFYNKNSIKNLSELKNFPIIDKTFVRENLNKIIISKYKDVKYSHTSGTTGSSIIFPITLECFQREYAFRTLHYLWSGVNLQKKPKIAMLSGHPVAKINRKKPPFWVYDYANNWLIFSSYHLSEELMPYYIKELKKFNPELIHGYPSSVYLIALAYKKYGASLSNLKSVYTASETLMDYQRKVIEEAFQVKLFNWYGNSEMCANIVECEKGRLHLKYEHSFVEILDENNNECKPGQKGRLICTGIGNPAFPLIRYDIKDEVVLSEEQNCPCDRGGLIVKEIIGREEDYIITPSGRRIGRLDHLFKDTLGIKQAQIYQGEVNKIEIRLITENGKLSEDDRQKLNNEIKLRLGDELKVEIVLVDRIERGPNNKFKFVVNELKSKEGFNNLFDFTT